MASEAKRLMEPYVPARNMVLSRNVRTYVEDGQGIVHYLSPYAHYQHEGILMVSRITGSPWARRGESAGGYEKGTACAVPVVANAAVSPSRG